jgi:5'-nucleotidase
MRVLLTNDDGVDAPGLRALGAALAQHHDLTIVAPDRDMSGSSAGIGRVAGVDDIVFEHRRLGGALEGVTTYTIAAGPGLAVLSACLGAFGDAPDLVVSGINSGANLGHSILHSGTVGAVLTAQNFGVRGLAVSAALGDPWRWDTAAAFALRIVEWLPYLPERTTINLNVPASDEHDVRGLRRATLDRFGTIRIALTGDTSADNGDHTRLQVELRDGAVDPEPGTDSALLAEGFATYTGIVGVAEVDLGTAPPAGSRGAVSQRVVSGGDG